MSTYRYSERGACTAQASWDIRIVVVFVVVVFRVTTVRTDIAIISLTYLQTYLTHLIRG